MLIATRRRVRAGRHAALGRQTGGARGAARGRPPGRGRTTFAGGRRASARSRFSPFGCRTEKISGSAGAPAKAVARALRERLGLRRRAHVAEGYRALEGRIAGRVLGTHAVIGTQTRLG